MHPHAAFDEEEEEEEENKMHIGRSMLMAPHVVPFCFFVLSCSLLAIYSGVPLDRVQTCLCQTQIFSPIPLIQTRSKQRRSKIQSTQHDAFFPRSSNIVDAPPFFSPTYLLRRSSCRPHPRSHPHPSPWLLSHHPPRLFERRRFGNQDRRDSSLLSVRRRGHSRIIRLQQLRLRLRLHR